jgi:glutathione S-transferase
MITVYGRATSSNVQPVMWMLAELGLRYTRLDYGHVHGGTDTPAFRAMNPMGLVPVIRDVDLVLWESCAILRYLGARYGGAPLWPADPVARAPIDQWAEWAKTTLYTAFTRPIFWARIRTPAADRDEAALALALARFEELLSILEHTLAPYAAGPDLTLADMVIGPQLYRYFTLPIPRPDRPRLDAYYARLQERPAYREHVMVSWAPLVVEGA